MSSWSSAASTSRADSPLVRASQRMRILGRKSGASVYVGNAGADGSRARFAAGDAAASAGRFARWSDIAAAGRDSVVDGSEEIWAAAEEVRTKAGTSEIPTKPPRRAAGRRMAPSLVVSARHTHAVTHRRSRRRRMVVASSGGAPPPKLVTFLGKGGSGKTTAAAAAAQYYASEGFKTCLVTQSQDPTAEQLMGCKIGNSLTECAVNLSTIKLETSKMLLEPLDRLKKVDAQVNFTQGVLEGIVGEELGVLPGMDSICSVLALQKLLNFFSAGRSGSQPEFDVVVYDCNNTEEILQLIGATDRARSYLRYVRDLAEKTDMGRLASPSLLKLIYDAARPNGKTSEGRLSTEIWNEIEQLLERVSVWFANPSNLACFLIIDPRRSISVSSALRYWGCTTQAGGQICGAFGYTEDPSEMHQEVAQKFMPLPFSLLPFLSNDSSADWSRALSLLSQNTKEQLRNTSIHVYPSVSFDSVQKSVTLFMPGFDKSEIKLYQYRGGSELLIEAGDQRRVIKLPLAMQGKVGGAKFVDGNLIVSIR